jgi:hypothetical protein
MQKPSVFFIEDGRHNRKRLAYEQNIFIETVIQGRRLSPCSGPIQAGRCLMCGAPTPHTPHPSKEDLMDFSTNLEALPDLMRFLLSEWSLQDLRLLGEILRVDDPLLICQDVIHIFQGRHPYGLIRPGTKRKLPRVITRVIAGSAVEFLHFDHIQQLAQDVYFIPITALSPDHHDVYMARLLIGRVVAYRALSAEILRAGDEDTEEQWIVFTYEQVPLVFAEHPEWRDGWQAALAAFLQAMEDLEARGKGG